MKPILAIFEYIFCLCILFGIVACAGSGRNRSSDGSDLPPIDTILEYPKKTAAISSWLEFSNFFGVYRVKQHIFAIVIARELLDDPFDALFKSHGLSDILNAIPDTGTTLFKNQEITEAFLPNGPEKLFLYCQRGMVKGIVDSVWYSYGECGSSIILKLQAIDTLRLGKPLIASVKKIDMTYAALPGFDNRLRKYQEWLRTKVDYPDNAPMIPFAFNEKYVFTYKDDFNWFEKSRNTHELNSAERLIFSVGDTAFRCQWQSSVDLIGIACI